MGNINVSIDAKLHHKLTIKLAEEDKKLKDVIPELIKKYVGDKSA